jgi:hypothetical protein
MPTWETTSRSATQEFSTILWNPKVNYRVNKEPSTGPYPELDESSSYHSNSLYFRSILILWRARCGPTKSTEEGRCVATDSHATIEGTAVFFVVCSEETVGWCKSGCFLWGPTTGYITRGSYRNSLKLRKACGIDGIPSNASDTFQEDH